MALRHNWDVCTGTNWNIMVYWQRFNFKKGQRYSVVFVHFEEPAYFSMEVTNEDIAVMYVFGQRTTNFMCNSETLTAIGAFNSWKQLTYTCRRTVRNKSMFVTSQIYSQLTCFKHYPSIHQFKNHMRCLVVLEMDCWILLWYWKVHLKVFASAYDQPPSAEGSCNITGLERFAFC